MDTGQTVEWVDAAISAVVQTQPALSLAFSDTVDERLYICNVYSGLLLVRQTFLTFFVNGECTIILYNVPVAELHTVLCMSIIIIIYTKVLLMA